MTSPYLVHDHEPLLLIGWSSVWLAPSYCVYMPICRACAVYGHWIFFSAHTQNRQLVDREQIFTEFDKKCIGLESLTRPLSVNWNFENTKFMYSQKMY